MPSYERRLPAVWRWLIQAGALIVVAFLITMFSVAWEVGGRSDATEVAKLTAQGQLLVSAAGLIISAVLAAITGWYAWTTREMVLEARATRLQDLEVRRREKSESAAAGALAAIHESRIGTTLGPQAETEAAEFVARRLRQHSPLVFDRVLADRINSCAEVARAYSIDSDAEWRHHDRGLARLRLRQIVESTRWSLEAYLAEHDLPAWDDLPITTSAFAWAHGPMRNEPDLAN